MIFSEFYKNSFFQRNPAKKIPVYELAVYGDVFTKSYFLGYAFWSQYAQR